MPSACSATLNIIPLRSAESEGEGPESAISSLQRPASCCSLGHFHPLRRDAMNWDRIAGNWKQAKGKMKEQWGKLTDDQLDQVAGKRDQLVGRIQESYGIRSEEHTSELQSRRDPVCRLLLEKKKKSATL